MSSIANFAILQDIGKGAYSQVHKVRRFSDGRIYAMKKIDMSKFSQKEKDNALLEISILSNINHNNVVTFHEAFLTDDNKSMCVIMDYADDGDLLSKVRKKIEEQGRFDENEVWNIAIQMIMGLKGLHDKKILHRDLKSANIFMYTNGTVKIGDLNVSKIMKEQLSYTQTGTPYYASPEIWRDKPYDFKSDIWSIGIIVYEVAQLIVPFKAEDIDGLYKKVCRGKFDPVDSNLYSPQLSQLIRMMLSVTPQQRPSCQQILAMPFVSSMMKKLGFQPQAMTPDQIARIEASHFQPSKVPQILAPYNQFYLSERLPKPNYKDNEESKTYLEQAKDVFHKVSHIRSYPFRKNKQPLIQDQDRAFTNSLFERSKDFPVNNIYSQLFGDEQDHVFNKIQQQKQAQKSINDKFKNEMEKRRVEKEKYYERHKENKHYFPEILLNKYDVNQKILSKLPYIPSTTVKVQSNMQSYSY